MLKLVHSTPIRTAEYEHQGSDAGATHPDIRLALGTRSLWHDPMGGLLLAVDQGSAYLVLLNGTAVRWSKMPGGTQAWGGFGWHVVSDMPIVATLDAAWAAMLLPQTQPVAEGWHDSYTGAESFAVLPDRKLYPFGRWIYAQEQIDAWTGGGHNECTLSNTLEDNIDQMHPAGPRPCRLWWCMSKSSGRCYLYDSTAKAVVGKARIPAGWLASGYSRKLDLFFAVRGPVPYTLEAYVNESVPASISVPAFAPAPRLGSLSKLSATVLGDDGEPCPGLVVQFAVSEGAVVPAAALSDASGKATVTYRAPLAATTGATATATVEE